MQYAPKSYARLPLLPPPVNHQSSYVTLKITVGIRPTTLAYFLVNGNLIGSMALIYIYYVALGLQYLYNYISHNAVILWFCTMISTRPVNPGIHLILHDTNTYMHPLTTLLYSVLAMQLRLETRNSAAYTTAYYYYYLGLHVLILMT